MVSSVVIFQVMPAAVEDVRCCFVPIVAAPALLGIEQSPRVASERKDIQTGLGRERPVDMAKGGPA